MPLPNGVEVVLDREHQEVMVRHSNDRAKWMSFSVGEWNAYLRTLELGYGAIYDKQGHYAMLHEGSVLVFNESEWTAFMHRVHSGSMYFPIVMQSAV